MYIQLKRIEQYTFATTTLYSKLFYIHTNTDAFTVLYVNMYIHVAYSLGYFSVV